jgi:hypothetical protein
MIQTNLEKLEMVHFMRFLKKNQILGKYMYNYHIQNSFVQLTKGQQIMSGFGWSKTKQGGTFWCKIEHQWNDEYQKFSNSLQ